MKIVAVNGGPRKNCNTAQLLDSFLNGVREALLMLKSKSSISTITCTPAAKAALHAS